MSGPVFTPPSCGCAPWPDAPDMTWEEHAAAVRAGLWAYDPLPDLRRRVSDPSRTELTVSAFFLDNLCRRAVESPLGIEARLVALCSAYPVTIDGVTVPAADVATILGTVTEAQGDPVTTAATPAGPRDH